jgi:hypothetical protein
MMQTVVTDTDIGMTNRYHRAKEIAQRIEGE